MIKGKPLADAALLGSERGECLRLREGNVHAYGIFLVRLGLPLLRVFKAAPRGSRSGFPSAPVALRGDIRASLGSLHPVSVDISLRGSRFVPAAGEGEGIFTGRGQGRKSGRNGSLPPRSGVMSTLTGSFRRGDRGGCCQGGPIP